MTPRGVESDSQGMVGNNSHEEKGAPFSEHVYVTEPQSAVALNVYCTSLSINSDLLLNPPVIRDT